MSITIEFREDDQTLIEKMFDENYQQVGKGYVIWNEYPRMGTVVHHFCLDGNEIDLSILSGCGISYGSCSGNPRIVGTDHEGRGWFIQMGEGVIYNTISIEKNRLRVSKEHIIGILKGRPFSELVVEIQRLVNERTIATLKAKAELADRAVKALEEIRAINETAGAGSRAKVRDIIARVLG